MVVGLQVSPTPVGCLVGLELLVALVHNTKDRTVRITRMRAMEKNAPCIMTMSDRTQAPRADFNTTVITDTSVNVMFKMRRNAQQWQCLEQQ